MERKYTCKLWHINLTYFGVILIDIKTTQINHESLNYFSLYQFHDHVIKGGGDCTKTNIKHLLKNNISTLKQIVWETQKWHHNFSRWWLIDQNVQNIVWINNSQTSWPTKFLVQFLSFSDNLLEDDYTILQNSVDNFEIVHKTCSILVWGKWLQCTKTYRLWL